MTFLDIATDLARRLRGLISPPFHYRYDAPQIFVDLPEPICGKLHCRGSMLLRAPHFLVANCGVNKLVMSPYLMAVAVSSLKDGIMRFFIVNLLLSDTFGPMTVK
jgi:hypothetical protein